MKYPLMRGSFFFGESYLEDHCEIFNMDRFNKKICSGF